MSENLRRQLKKLIRLSKSKITDIRRVVKKASKNLVRALSEIAYNITQGVVPCKKYSKNKVVVTLADANKPLTVKQRILKTFPAAEIIKTIIISVIPILVKLTLNG